MKIEKSYVQYLIDQDSKAIYLQERKKNIMNITLWYYDIEDYKEWNQGIFSYFFPFSCVIKKPGEYFNRREDTSNFIINTLPKVKNWLTEIAKNIGSSPASSPFVLTIRNFNSKDLSAMGWSLLDTLQTLEPENLKNWLRSQRVHFRQLHSWRTSKGADRPCFHDDRNYAFEPSPRHELHGRNWREEGKATCFLSGKFRFGTTLVEGFHYNVQPPRDRIEGEFFECDGTVINLSSKRYKYINIYPSYHLKPKEPH